MYQGLFHSSEYCEIHAFHKMAEVARVQTPTVTEEVIQFKHNCCFFQRKGITNSGQDLMLLNVSMFTHERVAQTLFWSTEGHFQSLFGFCSVSEKIKIS